MAVLSVILYHLDPRLMPGGYTGVDVFFVLSGYFITRQITHLMDTGSFSLIDFYDRRIRRLFPALFLMLAVTTILACVLFLPEDLELYARTLLGAGFSFSNVVFWQRSGYFEPTTQFEPLLHTWSLGVEEQFYLLFPPVLLVLWRHTKRWAARLTLLAVVSSFALSAYGVSRFPSATFYLLPTRAWELGLGVLLALAIVQPPRNRLSREISSALGLLMIVAACLWISRDFMFPGLRALLPCLGSALLIWSGMGDVAEGDAPATRRLLTLRPIVFVGLLSYSLYLWHWPIFSLAYYAYLGAPSVGAKAGLLGLVFLLSFLSYIYVEKPLRTGKHGWTTVRSRFHWAGISALMTFVMTLFLAISGGWPSRMSDEVVRYSAARSDFSPVRGTCHASGFGDTPFDETCVFGPSTAPGVIVFGDSHGAEISHALGETAIENQTFHVRQLTGSLCPPSEGFSHLERPDCNKSTSLWLNGLEKEPPSIIVIVAFYQKWHEEQSMREKFWHGFDKTLDRLTAKGHQIILLGGVPQHKYIPLPTKIASRKRYNPSATAYQFDRASQTFEESGSRLEQIAVKYSAEYIPITDFVCGTGHECNGLRDGLPIYFDDQHVTVTVSRALRDEIILPAIRRTNAAFQP